MDMQVRPSNKAFFDSLARRVKRLRQAHQMSQDQLAERAGVSQKAVSNLERPFVERVSPRLDTVVLVAQALGVPASALLVSGEFRENETPHDPGDDMIELAKILDKATPEQRQLILRLARATINGQG